jgi:hypothetical protein
MNKDKHVYCCNCTEFYNLLETYKKPIGKRLFSERCCGCWPWDEVDSVRFEIRKGYRQSLRGTIDIVWIKIVKFYKYKVLCWMYKHW